MKTLLTTYMAMLCLSASVCAQKKPLDTIPHLSNGEYGYQAVVTLDGTKQDELYRKAKLYFADNFKSANAVIQYDDRSEGKVVGKGLFKIQNVKTAFIGWYEVYWDVYYSTEISVKDGKYRYRMYDISITQSGKGNSTYIPTGVMSLDAMYSQIIKNNKLGKIYDLLNADMLSNFYIQQNNIKKYMDSKTSLANNDF